MPNETNTDKIRRLELNSATLDARVDNIREDLKQHEMMADELSKKLQSLERSFALAEHRLGEMERKLTARTERRWELWKLVLAALLGAMVAFLGALANRFIDQSVKTPLKRQSAIRASDDAPR